MGKNAGIWHLLRARGQRAFLPALLLAVQGCATTGATFGSGVGDAYLDQPPYYAGQSAAPVAASLAGSLAHLPVAYQRGAYQPSIFDPSHSDALQDLLQQMDSVIASLGISTLLAPGGTVSAVSHASTRHPPDVRFGCVTEFHSPGEDCDISDLNGGSHSQAGWMHLAVGRPSPEWILWVQELMAAAGAEGLLVITLEVGQYRVRQKNLKGSKEVVLGTNHRQSIPWITSLDAPVDVLQLTGVVVGRDGKAVRAGAEGLMAKRTSLLASSLGAQAILTEQDVESLLAARRDDLPGSPLVWETGLRTLVGQLTGSPTEGREQYPPTKN